ncbi:MAG TPA: 16S rRNA (adenine(1518)-N(6)/adenine(1519)-N(6))-dimethyltransferase RsmA [Gammaproteobacteria bacterium]
MDHRPRKRFGQNFLHDRNVIERIIRTISPQPGQHLVEIGPGLGALTEHLVAAGGDLDVVELDRDLIPPLAERFGALPHFRIHNADALRFDFSTLVRDDEKLRVVGNLPYNISTPLLFHLLDHHHVIRDMYFMLQLEVVNRLAAHPGDDDYGRLSVMIQYHCQVDKLFTVPPGAFTPAPKVYSAIVRLLPHTTPPHPADDEQMLSRLVAQAFSQRRKTLRNTLKGLLDAKAIEALGIDGTRRPETLSLAEFVVLANAASRHAPDKE